MEFFLKINKQAGLKKASRGGKMLKINKRACSFIGYLRVSSSYKFWVGKKICDDPIASNMYTTATEI